MWNKKGRSKRQGKREFIKKKKKKKKKKREHAKGTHKRLEKPACIIQEYLSPKKTCENIATRIVVLKNREMEEEKRGKERSTYKKREKQNNGGGALGPRRSPPLFSAWRPLYKGAESISSL